MPFSNLIISRAWNRQAGLCAYCGKKLTWNNYQNGDEGAWHPHHRKPESEGGSDTLDNCVVLCINEPVCHLFIGHGGNWAIYCELNDQDLPYLYAGNRMNSKEFEQFKEDSS